MGELVSANRSKGIILLARWTTDWDCKKETEWWYIIKDKPFEISSIKAKRRYEINKGLKNFDIRVINPITMRDDIYNVTVEAYKGWPKKYRPNITKEQIYNSIESWRKNTVFGEFEKKTGKLVSYAILGEKNGYIEFSSLRTISTAEKLGANAAIIFEILNYYKERLEQGIYISDGARAIRHETAFQDYLEKYFGFRKAYCKLKIIYRPIIAIVIKVIYPFRHFFSSKSKIGSKVVAILKMEEIRRKCL